MRWIGQHIYDFVSRFGNDVYIDNGSTSINSTISGAAALLDITSAPDQNGPIVTIKNTKEANTGGTLQFLKFRPSSVGAAGDDIGTINFNSEDDDGSSLTYVSILGEISDPTDGSPEGKISILARHHSSFGNVITGEGNGDGVVDVSLALGASSTTTIAGDLSVTTGLILDSVDITTVQTSAESFADNDTSLMTSAAIDDRIVAATSSTFVDLTSEVSGTLPVANGGTGATSLTDNKLLTGTGTSAVTAEANATYDGADLSLTSATSTKPILSIENTTNDGNAGELKLIGRRSSDASILAGAGDDTGTISFVGENAKSGPDPETITYGKIVGENSAATDGAEMGKMTMSIGVNQSAIGGSLGFFDFLSSTSSVVGETTTYGSGNLLSSSTFDSTITVFQSAVSTGPQMTVRNHTDDATGGSLAFLNSRGALANDTANQNGDDLGSILWHGFDSGVGITTFAKMLGEAESVTHTDEAGKLSLTVATSDGSTSALQNAFTATGQATNNYISTTIGYGAASVATIAGTLTMGSTAAMTNAGLLSVANQSNITGLGTISSGTWEGTDVGVAHGGTGLSTVGANEILTGNGTGALTSEAGLTYDAETLTIGDDDNGTVLIQRLPHTDGQGGLLQINAGDATDGQTDKGGGRLYLQGGRGTGAGVSGFVGIRTSAVDPSGTHLQAEADYNWIFGNDGQLVTPTNGFGIKEYFDFNTVTFENVLADGDPAGTKILKYSPGANDTLADGQIFFLHTDGTWDQADASATSTGASQLLCVGNGNARTSGVVLDGFVRIPSTEILNTPGSGAVDGLPLYVSTTAGHFDFTAPSGNNEYVRVVGYAIDDDSSDVLVYFNPDSTHVKITA